MRPIFVVGLLIVGCTIEGGETTFLIEGLQECRAYSPGSEDLPVYIFDSKTAKPTGRIGIGVPSSISATTIYGKRVTLTGEVPPGYACKGIEESPGPVSITQCYEWWIGDSKDPCPEGYGEVIVNTPTSDLNELDCKESIGILVVCGRVAQ